jgi:ubiquinone/menaquinone biosynthesis C-methylase UbiE
VGQVLLEENWITDARRPKAGNLSNWRMGMQHLDRKAQALSMSDHLYWLHFRTLEPFIISQLNQSKAPMLDLGCGNRPYKPHYPPGEVVGADVVQSSHGCVEVILESNKSLPFEDNRFETILCTQVLEHVENPYLVLSETHRILRPGGRMILTCPFIWELHERPHDYLRFSEYWLTKNLVDTGFHIEMLDRQGGDLATIGQMICLSMAVRQIHMPKVLQKIYNRFWAYLDRKSPTQCMPLNYGIVCVKNAGSGRRAEAA